MQALAATKPWREWQLLGLLLCLLLRRRQGLRLVRLWLVGI